MDLTLTTVLITVAACGLTGWLAGTILERTLVRGGATMIKRNDDNCDHDLYTFARRNVEHEAPETPAEAAAHEEAVRHTYEALTVLSECTMDAAAKRRLERRLRFVLDVLEEERG